MTTFFSIDTGYLLYICQENSYDMYVLYRGETRHIWLQARAHAESARREGYNVVELDEEGIRLRGLWRGSFMRSKSPRRVV